MHALKLALCAILVLAGTANAWSQQRGIKDPHQGERPAKVSEGRIDESSVRDDPKSTRLRDAQSSLDAAGQELLDLEADDIAYDSDATAPFVITEPNAMDDGKRTVLFEPSRAGTADTNIWAMHDNPPEKTCPLCVQVPRDFLTEMARKDDGVHEVIDDPPPVSCSTCPPPPPLPPPD